MTYSRILGVGSYVPARVVTNNDLKTLMDTSDEWIVQRTGIRERHWVAPEESNADLALKAAERALEAARVKKEELEMIIYATLSPDHEFPGTGCFFQGKLGVSGCATLDIRQQCTGFLYGLSIADQFVRNGVYKKVLVVGSEIHSRGLDLSTRGREVSVLFGDGAGAAVVSACDGAPKDTDARIYSTHLHADGAYARELWIPAPGSAGPGTQRLVHEMIDKGEHYPHMNGKAVFVHAVKRMPESILEVLKANGKTVADVDLFVFHQANLRINEMVAKQLGIPETKVFNTIDRFGNTTAATIPLGLDTAVKEGKLKPGMLVASAAFGSGFTWASALFRW